MRPMEVRCLGLAGGSEQVLKPGPLDLTVLVFLSSPNCFLRGFFLPYRVLLITSAVITQLSKPCYFSMADCAVAASRPAANILSSLMENTFTLTENEQVSFIPHHLGNLSS